MHLADTIADTDNCKQLVLRAALHEAIVYGASCCMSLGKSRWQRMSRLGVRSVRYCDPELLPTAGAPREARRSYTCSAQAFTANNWRGNGA